MKKEISINDLKNFKIFETVNEKYLKKFHEKMSTKCFNKGATIIKEGDNGDSILFLIKGDISISQALTLNTIKHKTNDNREKELIRINSEEQSFSFGEVSLLNTDKKRTATVKTNSECIIVELKFLDNSKQINLQSNFFNLKKISFYLGEARYRKKNIRNTLSYFYNNFKNNSFLGVSTGLFAILFALYENEDCEIIISGIGFDGGPQFYKSLREVDQNHLPRARVDEYLMKNIKKIHLNKIATLDTNTAIVANINLWNGIRLS